MYRYLCEDNVPELVVLVTEMWSGWSWSASDRMALAMFTDEMAVLLLLVLLLVVTGGSGQPGRGEPRGEPGEFLGGRTFSVIR